MRIFVIWDMTIPNLSADLVALKAHPKLAGTTLEMMGPDLYTQGSALQRIRAHLDHPETEGALAVLDEANANVGFEVGLALALRRPVALLTKRAAHRAWAERPPLNGLLLHPRSFGATTVAETVQRLRDGGPSAWCHLPERPTGGDGVLLLWPEDSRGELYEGALPPTSPRRLPVDGWALDGLPRQLTGVGRVVWVVLQPEPGERDGGENARLAVVAGYCHGLGVELHVLVEEPPDPAARALVDLRGLRKAWYGVEQLRELLVGLLQPGPRPAPDALVAWRAWLRRRHAELIPFAPGMTETVLQRVVVELRLQRRGEGPALQDHTLRSLLELLSRPGQIGRVLVRAEPGAGKTTAARHVAWQMGADDARHVVVLVPLVELGGRSPLQHAEQQSGIEGLAARLADEAKVPGRLWLLLDGLDEVGLAHIHSTLATIRELATSPAWAGVVLVVLGRDVAFRHDPLREPWAQATLQRLDGRQQLELLRRLVPDEGQVDQLRAHIRRWPALGELAGNPLLLTLLAVVGRSALQRPGASVPWTRVELYRQAVDLLLEGGHREQKTPVRSPHVARAALAGLALELQESGGETWDAHNLAEALLRVAEEDPQTGDRVARIWGAAPEALRDDLDHNGGVLGRLDGNDRWRFLHRSVREFLAAEGLVRRPGRRVGFEERWLGALAAEQAAEGEDGEEEAQAEAARAGEVLALLASIEGGPDERLDELQQNNPDALVRLLKGTEGLQAARVVELMFGLYEGLWHVDDLVTALLNTAGDRCAPLWARVVPDTPRKTLGLLYDALTHLGGEDRARFFAACGLGLPKQVELELVDIPAGSFVMGSPEGVGHDDEHPAHPVTLGAFRLGRTAVTVAQYQRFDPQHTCPGGATHPVTKVSWYEALLFAAWLGGRLPTEAEWEYACRAGTATAWSFGDEEADLERHAWYRKNSGGQTRPVGEKLPNPWGLYDLHGNVWEWCQDDLRTYTEEPATDPRGEPSGGRAVRGGGWWNGAGGCRSAARDRWGPGGRNVDRGFRVLLPAPASDGPLSS
jgi:hypothetical protein